MQASPSAAASPGDPIDHCAQALIGVLRELGHPGFNMHQRYPEDDGSSSYEFSAIGEQGSARLTGPEFIRKLELDINLMRESL